MNTTETFVALPNHGATGANIGIGTNGNNAYMCAVATSGILYCWGENAKGTLGDGTTVDKYNPTPVSAGWKWTPSGYIPTSGNYTWSSVAVGITHTCAVTIDSRGFCWGRNGDGQLGEGTVIEDWSPTEVYFHGVLWDSIDVADYQS